MCRRTEEQEEKRAFVIQYVLNRAAAVPRGLDGYAVVEEAIRAWEEIKFHCR